MALVLAVAAGTMQVALFLFARNMVQASAHEAARAAAERGTRESEARAVATRMSRGAIGGMTRGLAVDLEKRRVGERDVVTVQVATRIAPPGPLPVSVMVRASATVGSSAEPR